MGAAVVPPNPAPTSITATATFGCSAGAKATNHASASLGLVEFGRSSAVPVLPATCTPGIAAAVPVPERTTSSIIERTSWAIFVGRTWLERIGSIVVIRGGTRRPSSAIVAATLAICSGVARSRSWPIAAAPTARLSRSWEGGEIVLGFASGILGCWSNPKARAVATRRLAPSLAPSGANTELHDTVNASVNEPPQASPDAFRSATPDSVAEVRTGYVVEGVAIPSFSAADTVMILNVDPGGWGGETA